MSEEETAPALLAAAITAVRAAAARVDPQVDWRLKTVSVGEELPLGMQLRQLRAWVQRAGYAANPDVLAAVLELALDALIEKADKMGGGERRGDDAV